MSMTDSILQENIAEVEKTKQPVQVANNLNTSFLIKTGISVLVLVVGYLVSMVIRTTLKKLEEIGVVRTELKGLPAKLHWRIDTNQLKQVAETSIQRSWMQVSSDHGCNSSMAETSIQRSWKQVYSDHGSNSSINTTKNKNRDNDIKKDTKSEKERLLDEIKETPSQKKIRVQEEFWEVVD
jgi:hypothetical protein